MAIKSNVKLYSDRVSGSTRRVQTVLEHLDIEYEFFPLDLFKGEQKQSGYLAKNPNGAVPVITDGSITLWEGSAINIYLSETYNNALLPVSGVERFETLKWMFWAGEHIRAPSLVYFNENVGKKILKLPADEAALRRGEETLRPFLKVLDNQLKERRFVIGDRVTLADFDIAGPFSQYIRSKVPFPDYSNVMAWHQRLIDEVPAWRHTRAQLEERIIEVNRAFATDLEVGEC